MSVVLVLLLVFASLVLLFAAARNATTLCVLEVHAGVVTVKRGALAAGILADIEDVVRRPTIGRATVRISRSQGGAEVVVKGEVSDAQKQQLRNVIGRVPLAKLMNARGRRR